MEGNMRRQNRGSSFAVYEQRELANVQNRITENVALMIKKKTMHDSNLITNCLKNHFIFYNLSESELQNVKEKMFFCEVAEGTYIFREGSIGHCFFVVQKGLMEMLLKEQVKKQIKPQDGFGQLALLYHTERTFSIRVRESGSMWALDRQSFREAVEEAIIRQYNENRKCLDVIKFFNNLTHQQKDIIASAFVSQKYYKGQTIIEEGDPGSSLYYIKDGSVSVFKGSKLIRKMGKSDSFGQQSLYYNTMRQLSIKADDEVTCLVLGRDTLNRVLGDKIYDVTFINFIKWAFEKNPLLCKLNKVQTEKVIDSMTISSYKANEVIYKKGTTGFHKIVVVIEGSLKKLKNGTIVASKGQCWGEDFLLEVNRTKVLGDDIVMQIYGVLAQISDTVFFESIGGISYQEVIKKIEKTQERSLPVYINPILKDASNISLEDLLIVSKLADSQFGVVYLVCDEKKNLYVIKTLAKGALEQYEVERFIRDECKVMKEISFPFVLQMIKSFRSDRILFYMTQFVQGQDFYDVMREIGLFSTEDSQFYIATIILILEEFQKNMIVSRDIKPENFMVDSKGYLKLIGMSTAKAIKNQTTQMKKTFTVIGTPHYMSPDIILGKGYNNLADLWSLGVCLYEFMCGVLPFGDSTENPYQIFEDIMQSELKFPQFMSDKKARKLIEQLLSHNPQQRHSGSFDNLKAHPWLENFPWIDLYQRSDYKLKPPFVPHNRLKSMKSGVAAAKKKFLDYLRGVETSTDSIIPEHSEITDSWESFGEMIEISDFEG